MFKFNPFTGNLDYYESGAAGADVALSNLVNTAVNASIVPAATNAVSLGSAAKLWASVFVADEAYGVGWDGSNSVPTKNAVYDKIETISASGLTSPQILARTLGS